MRQLTAVFTKLNLNNFSIVILIYLLCIIVPIIVLSWFFYYSVSKSAKMRKLILHNQAVERIGNEILSIAVSAILSSNTFYPDVDMYRFLNRTYQDTQEYLDVYY